MNYRFYSKTGLLILFTGLFCQCLIAQSRNTRPGTITTEQQPIQTDRQGRVLPSRPGISQGTDSLKRRDNSDDSITIYFKFFDSTRIRFLDSSVSDFATRYYLPAHYITLGNNGAAARSLIFTPHLRAGFNVGFHAFDIYKFKVHDTKFFQTTRPYTELGYLIGAKGEQIINLIHTQNIQPNFNMAFQYRLINSPGEFQNQNTNHNSYRLNGNYQSRNKRYTAYGIYMVNKSAASENGGIQRDTLLSDYRYANRFAIPTRLSGDSNALRNPFNSKVVTGNVYSEKIFLYRQQYDLGQRDSIKINDSTYAQLFYPRLRFQHTFTTTTQIFEFRDNFTGPGKIGSYKAYFGIDTAADNILFRNSFQLYQNELSLISFPQKNNLNQFIKTGITHQLIRTEFTNTQTFSGNHYNILLLAEYRNRTRNQKWDVEAAGNFYINGFNSGDYDLQIELKRQISTKLGFLQLGFQNVNRTPSYIFSNINAFPIKVIEDYKKENTSRMYASYLNSQKIFSVHANYYLMSNYTYSDGFLQSAQFSPLFTVLQLSANKRFKLTSKLNYYADLSIQQTTGSAPVNVPLFHSTNRLSLEGVYAKNLVYAVGMEVKYYSNYKADNYSPFTGQFFYQNTYTLKNRPEVNVYFNFRIKRFYTFFRVENLNTISRNTGNLGFNKNNYAAQFYPQQGLWIRIGIWWRFIN